MSLCKQPPPFAFPLSSSNWSYHKMGLTGGPLYRQEGYLQREVFSEWVTALVRRREVLCRVCNTPSCTSHSLVISPLQTCPAQPCLPSNCGRSQNTRYGSCRHRVVKKIPAFTCTSLRGRRRESALNRRQHLQQAGVSLTKWDIKDSFSDLLFDRLASLWFTELIN